MRQRWTQTEIRPIQIEADIAVRDEGAGETRYEGNVILTQGSLRITAELISIKHDSAAADKIVATGQARHLGATTLPAIKRRLTHRRERSNTSGLKTWCV